jgi:hypothetical protein
MHHLEAVIVLLVQMGLGVPVWVDTFLTVTEDGNGVSQSLHQNDLIPGEAAVKTNPA